MILGHLKGQWNIRLKICDYVGVIIEILVTESLTMMLNTIKTKRETAK